ncbi:MAG: radical SAM protein [Fibrobacteria bacterium]|nr:radical SAM protein [Fibrobacteria bacterium]
MKLNEIFFSIQGEGYHSGTAAVFIRTANCNFSCSFCDTDFSENMTLTGAGILKHIKSFPVKFVVITGGEPTLQTEAISDLISLLHTDGYYVSLETNGSSLNRMGADWITVSPKDWVDPGLCTWLCKQGDELKLLYNKQDLSFYENSDFSHYFLQPISNSNFDLNIQQPSLQQIVEIIKKHPKWRLSLQLHKILHIQ